MTDFVIAVSEIAGNTVRHARSAGSLDIWREDGEIVCEIRDAGGRAIRTFPVPAPRSVLASTETARFRASLPAPPPEGRTVILHFADAEIPQGESHDGPTGR